MKSIALFTLSLALNFQAFATDWEQIVRIEKATCSYDQYGYPRIEISISPGVIVDGKVISKFTNASTHEMCPNMNEILDKRFARVTLQTKEESFYYELDDDGICNRYETKTLFMFFSRLRMLSPIKKTLKERNLSIGQCIGGY